jgi:tubulin-specific chaperone A
MATLRNLKIKTGTCKRIVKELHSYEKEIEREAAKTADMKEKGADPYDLKQQVISLVENFIAYLVEGISIYSYSNIFL